MAKVISTKKQKPFDGGRGNHMFGRQSAGPQKPGQSASAGNKASKEKFAKGGRGHMFPKQTSKPVKGGRGPV